MNSDKRRSSLSICQSGLAELKQLRETPTIEAVSAIDCGTFKLTSIEEADLII